MRASKYIDEAPPPKIKIIGTIVSGVQWVIFIIKYQTIEVIITIAEATAYSVMLLIFLPRRGDLRRPAP